MANHEIRSNEFSTDLTDDASGVRVESSLNFNNLNVNITPPNAPNDTPESFDLSNVTINAQNRTIRVNRQLQDVKFISNAIRFLFKISISNYKTFFKTIYYLFSTSKYNLITFLPKFLFEQFSKYSNIFFFMIVMLQV